LINLLLVARQTIKAETVPNEMAFYCIAKLAEITSFS